MIYQQNILKKILCGEPVCFILEHKAPSKKLIVFSELHYKIN